MSKLYLEVFSHVDLNGVCLAPLETLISLFTYIYCGSPTIAITFIVSSKTLGKVGFKLKTSKINFDIIDEEDVSSVAKFCKLPVLVSSGETTVVAGLCAVLRRVIKLVNLKHPLLGFKQSSLYACAESSLWTRFCEIDIIKTVNDLFIKNDWKCSLVEIPKDVARFEIHMSSPVKIHNIQKEKQDLARSSGLGRKSRLPDSRLDLIQDLDHKYTEGARVTLADILLYPSFRIILENLGSKFLKEHLPLIHKWYDHMSADGSVKKASKIFVKTAKKFDKEIYISYIFPNVDNQSLYKGEVRKNLPKRHFFTQQEEIEECLEKVKEIEGAIEVKPTTFGKEIDFDWTTVPTDFHLDSSQVPVKRLERKGQQLQNMTKAVLKIAKFADQIVDFCSGSGHLGLILAHALPRCSIILVENKEQSLSRAKERAKKLKLSNVVFCQSNVDYFIGRFDIGVSLHACGVATDLVIEKCIQQRAAFVCCPCCYGSIQLNHMISYPRSEIFRKSRLTLKDYLVLGHASDQTHDEKSVKTSQGNRCMAIIDSDRCLKAKDAGYYVVLSKLEPSSCTPKNNLLVGIPGQLEFSNAGMSDYAAVDLC